MASLDVDPTGRFLYHVPGAHGGGKRDGFPLVRLDVRTVKKKVLAFLSPYYPSKYGFTPEGTYRTAIRGRRSGLRDVECQPRNTSLGLLRLGGRPYSGIGTLVHRQEMKLGFIRSGRRQGFR